MSGFAQATTNSSGFRLIGGIDVQNLKTCHEYGKRADPWEQISHARSSRTHRIEDFFKENDKGDLIHRHLGVYNLLMRHIMREVSPEMGEEVRIRKNGRVKEIAIADDVFLVFQGRIYRKKVKELPNKPVAEEAEKE